jgi:Fur family ferric uptake transcriptional regulator
VCTKCHQTQCLDDVHIPYVKMPDGFEMEKAEMVVSGICKNCRFL